MIPKANCSDRIREGMRMARMKQVDLVKKTGIPKSTMSRYVNGKFRPKQDALALIAEALNVDEGWLMGFNVPPDRKPKLEIFVDQQDDMSGIVKFLQEDPDAMAVTISLKKMTKEEIQELARYGKFLRQRDGIK